MLRLEGVSKYYYGNDVVALGLRKVSLELKLGEFVAVTGESGSGKSTLLNVISGLDTYEDGELYVNGEETSYYTIEEWESYRRQYIGFVFQNYNIIDSYSVLENVMVALTIQGYDKATRRERALELIDKVGLSSHIHHKASKLSGGQKQRAVIARALAKDCPIIVADEPTGNLDTETGKQIISLLKEISRDKLVVVVTHNYDQVAEYATRRIRLFDGEIVEDKVYRARDNDEEGITLANYRMSYGTLMVMALRNLVRTPRRTLFSIIVAMFISLLFMFSFGAFTQGTSDGGYSYGGGFYSNVHTRRIIVTNFDETAFTQAQLTELEALDDVLYVLDHDVILDSTVYQYYDSYGYINFDNFFVNPAGMLREEDLKEGRLPENEFEVVVEQSDTYEIGDMIKLGFGDRYFDEGMGTSSIDGIDMEIVGIVRNINPNTWQGYMFFHDDFIAREDVMLNAYFSYGWGRQITNTSFLLDDGTDSIRINIWGSITVDNDLADGDVELGYYVLDEISWNLFEESFEDNPDFFVGMDLTIEGSTNFYTNSITLDIAGEYDPAASGEEKFYNSNIAMNSDTVSELLPEDTYQVTLMVLDSFDAESVLDELEELGYNAIYPSSIGTEFDDIWAIWRTFWFTVGMLVLMFVMYWVTYAVLRNVQAAKRKDYLIFRSIGASQKDLYKVTNLEMVYTFLTSLLVVFAFFIYNEINQIWVIPQYLRFFTVGTYVVLVLILFTLAVLLGRRFNKRIFGRSVITSLRQE